MASEFSDQVPLSNVEVELLPLFHTCEAYDARGHMRKSSIETDDVCEVFREQITYMFYGRPAFKYKTTGKSSRDLSLYPVAFVLNTSSVGTIKRVYPFDSGAMHHKFYEMYFNNKMTYMNFEMDGSTSRITDIVLHFFGSNSNYMNHKTANNKIAPLSFESKSFAEMIDSAVSSPADERRATIEVQGDRVVPITPASLSGMVVPAAFRDDPDFKLFAVQNKALVESYDVTVWNPEQCFALVQLAAKRLITRMGIK